jgi:hypothetical protein
MTENENNPKKPFNEEETLEMMISDKTNNLTQVTFHKELLKKELDALILLQEEKYGKNA